MAINDPPPPSGNNVPVPGPPGPPGPAGPMGPPGQPAASLSGLTLSGIANVSSGTIAPNTIANTFSPCEGIGHLAREVMPYLDGVVAGECERCKVLLTFVMPSGGSLRAEADHMVMAFLEQSKRAELDPELADNITIMAAKLRIDLTALQGSLSMLETIETGLRLRRSKARQ